jgi:SAM-dependent methyltransferase
MRAWLAPAKLRRRFSRVDGDAWRRSTIERLVPGKSFLDMGGMWGVNGGMAFHAEQAGANRVVLCDGMDPTPEFIERQQQSSVGYVQGDLHDPGTIERLGSFDVVWCTGVLYHTPDPYRLLAHLRQLTTETLILGTRVLPEVPGMPGACLFYPALEPAQRASIGWAHGKEAPGLVGAATPVERGATAADANYWWGMTPSAVRAMLDLARFRIVEECQPHPLTFELVAEAVSGDEILPQLDFSRQRGLDREQGLLT